MVKERFFFIQGMELKLDICSIFTNFFFFFNSLILTRAGYALREGSPLGAVTIGPRGTWHVRPVLGACRTHIAGRAGVVGVVSSHTGTPVT